MLEGGHDAEVDVVVFSPNGVLFCVWRKGVVGCLVVGCMWVVCIVLGDVQRIAGSKMMMMMMCHADVYTLCHPLHNLTFLYPHLYSLPYSLPSLPLSQPLPQPPSTPPPRSLPREWGPRQSTSPVGRSSTQAPCHPHLPRTTMQPGMGCITQHPGICRHTGWRGGVEGGGSTGAARTW